jgi:glucose/arabinose dehydrogenase
MELSLKRARVCAIGAAAGVAVLAGAPAAAQRDASITVGGAPEYAVPPLPDEPVDIVTAEQNIRVTVVARGLQEPWGMTFPSDDVILVAERDGAIRVIRDGVLEPDPVEGGPQVARQGLSGFDLALHPDFAENGLIYYAYPRDIGGDQKAVSLGRARWDGEALHDDRVLFTADAGLTGGSRIAFGADNTIYMSFTGQDPQDATTLGGKVIRLNDDGTVPTDNPFFGKPGHRPEIFSMGHRVIIGLARQPGTNEMWAVENGPNGGDELNHLVAGGNYGWPLVSLGRDYAGPWQSEEWHRDGFEDPVVFWTPSIAPAGLAFYRGDTLPGWNGDVFVGGLRYGEISGTGRLHRIVFNLDMQEMRREALLTDWRQRIRDVREGPDGDLYLLTDGEDAALLRIEPVPASEEE